MSILRSRLWTLRELQGVRELALFVYVTAFAALVPVVMRMPLPRVARLVTRPPRARRRRYVTAERLERLVALAPTFARPLVRTGCLTRGITLFWFLRRAGVDVELTFGVDPVALDGEGHCWLTLDGEPFLEKVDPRARFTETYRLPLVRA